MLADHTYPLQVIWGKKKLTSLEDIKSMKLRVRSPSRARWCAASAALGDDHVRRKSPPRSTRRGRRIFTAASAPCCGRTC